MSDATQLRLIIAVIGALLLAAMYFFGQPRKSGQGSRTPKRAGTGERIEPTLGEPHLDDGELDPELQAQLDRMGDEIRQDRADEEITEENPVASARSNVGARPDPRFERIVTLYVAARPGETMAGPELVVAAEKAGLDFGNMGIFHRLVEGKPTSGPVFSVASMVKPGSFDMTRINELRIPGVTFFMTLPGPMTALDAWDTMYPAAQRLAELLDAQVLDEEKNAIGRQTIQHIRDELRGWDRKQERNVIKKSW